MRDEGSNQSHPLATCSLVSGIAPNSEKPLSTLRECDILDTNVGVLSLLPTPRALEPKEDENLPTILDVLCPVIREPLSAEPLPLETSGFVLT